MKINRILSGLMAVMLLLCAYLPAATAQDVSAQLTKGPWEMTMPGYGAAAYMSFFEDCTGSWYIGDWMEVDFLWSVYDCVYKDGTVETYMAISFIDEEGVYLWGYMNMPYQDNSYLLTASRTGLSLQDVNHSGYDLAGHSAQKSINLERVAEIPFEVHGWFNASSDQTGIICRDRIYPRPGPDDGKNEHSYEAPGQEIIIHSRALSMKGTERWWLCISGTIKAWGDYYELDHVWIREDYIDPFSYDFDLVPLDPQYGF